MPVYDYKCKEHGVFNELSTLAASEHPCACPVCGKLSARIIRLPPTIFEMPEARKKAHELNERNQHEPTCSSLARRMEDDLHAKGCGCEQKPGQSKAIYTARGEKIFPSMRPWMISH